MTKPAIPDRLGFNSAWFSKRAICLFVGDVRHGEGRGDR